jgi:hypothetical protein
VFSSTHGCARLGRRTTRAAVSTAAALVAAAALAGPASADLTAAGPPALFNGFEFPESYTDAAGQTLELCLDGVDTPCGAAEGGLAPDEGEAFYWSAETDPIALSGGGTVEAVFAVEAAFGGDANDIPVTFSRMRYSFNDAALGTYTVQTPWGPQSVVNDGSTNVGADIGCDPVAPPETCDFDLALTTPISTFLHQVSTTPPFLGSGPLDVGVAGPVVGSPTGFNSVSVSGPGGTGSTSDFYITGKLAGAAQPILAAAPLALGTQATGTAGAVQNVTVRNDGLTGSTLTATGTPTITGPDAADFAVVGTTCVAPLAAGESCTVGVRFTPSAAGARSATLNLPTNALVGTGVALSGTGVTPAATPPGAAAPAANTVVVVRAPQSTVQARQVRALAVSNLTVARRISVSRPRSRGLRMSMTVPAGTRVVRVQVFRARNGRKTGRALATVFRAPSRAGLFRVTLRDRALLRRLRAGQYIVEIRPGTSRSALGATARRTFRVVTR